MSRDDYDPDYFDDDRPATVGDIRMLLTRMSEMFMLCLAGLFGATEVGLAVAGYEVSYVLVMAIAYLFLVLNHVSSTDGRLRDLYKLVTFGKLSPSRPARNDREIGDRSEPETEVAD